MIETTGKLQVFKYKIIIFLNLLLLVFKNRIKIIKNNL